MKKTVWVINDGYDDVWYDCELEKKLPDDFDYEYFEEINFDRNDYPNICIIDYGFVGREKIDLMIELYIKNLLKNNVHVVIQSAVASYVRDEINKNKNLQGINCINHGIDGIRYYLNVTYKNESN